MIISLLVGAALATNAAALGVQDRPVVRTAADLPQTSYVLGEVPSVAFLDPAFMADTVPALRLEAERILNGYEIEDAVVLQRLRTGLAAIANLEGRPDDAQRLLATQRQAESKPQLKAIGFLLAEAVAAGGLVTDPERCRAAADRVSALLDAAAPEVVHDQALAYYAQAQVASVGYYAGGAAGYLDPAYESRGSLSLMEGLDLAFLRMISLSLPHCRDEVSAALSQWLSVPSHKPADIWGDRQPEAAVFNGASPVTVAVWDSGYDPSLFVERLAIDPAEPLDGWDNDGNGVIDDINGPTFDYRLLPTRFPFPPLSEFLVPRFAFQQVVSKGEQDLSYGLDTAEARFFAQRAREASTAEQGEDIVSAGEIGARSHGTAVAGIIAREAPWVRLYNVYALPWGEQPEPVPFSEPEIARWVALMPAIGERLRGANVRVVNMSWGVFGTEFADQLLNTGQETDPERATARGRAMHNQVELALRALIQACPDILFVTGSGNINASDEALAAIPQTFDLPNIVVAGAAATNGRATAFTTFGDTVDLYALGENIPVVLPGGIQTHGQGTSYAAPGVAHAAAAMLAVNSALSPAELISGLMATATDGEAGLRLLHLARAVNWAKARIP